jgi:hypothetical protein
VRIAALAGVAAPHSRLPDRRPLLAACRVGHLTGRLVRVVRLERRFPRRRRRIRGHTRWEPPGPTAFFFDGKRRSGTSVITGLGKAFLHYNQNRNGIGTGSGVCFGDSGSPQFDQGTLRVLSLTTGGNGQCNANNINYRVDTPQAREFLGQFLNLP